MTMGERFTWKGLEFVALGEEQGGLLAIAAEPVCESPFDDGEGNDWRKSSLREYLNEDFLDEIGKEALLPFASDLTADDGLKDYGTAEDYVFLLSADLYRKYRQYIPKYKSWWWLITPWTTIPDVANIVRFVSTSGALGDYCADYSNGVVPGLLFNLKSLEKQLGDAPAAQSAEDGTSEGDAGKTPGLEDIVWLLSSGSYKDREKGEYWLVKTKYEKLHRMIIKREAGKLDFRPTCPMEQWKAQASAMGKYLYQLEVKAEYEGIDYSDTAPADSADG